MFEQAARIVAQIEHVPLKRRADLLLQLAHGFFQAAGRLFVEGGEPDIADVALAMPFDAVDMNDGAHQRHVEGLFLAVAQDRERDLGADGTTHLVDGVVERHALDGIAVDGGNVIAGLEAGLGGGRIVDGRDHLDESVFHRHFDADAAELAFGLDLHVGEAFCVHVARMGIEARHHAFDGTVDQLVVLNRAHIVGADLFEGVAEEIELAIGTKVVGTMRRRQYPDGDNEADDNAHTHTDENGAFHDLFAFLNATAM